MRWIAGLNGNWHRIVVLAVVFLGWCAGSVEGSIVFCTPTGSVTKDGLVNAQVSFSLYDGSVTVTLTNLLQNPRADAQLISGVRFTATGASGTGALATTNSGMIATISKGGAYPGGNSDSLARWKAAETGEAITLTALSGGAPNQLIIGPDDMGGFTGTGSYSDANKSITGKHNPSVLGSATFEIAIPGITTDSTISDVVFQFGTSANENLVNGQRSTTHSNPEPSTLAIWSLLGGVGAFAASRRHRVNSRG
jgi:hypothetical protein